MPITPNFTVTQTIGSPNILDFTDTSIGSDVTVTERRITLLKADGTYLVPAGVNTNYFVWALANVTEAFDVLNKDYALTITVDWVNSSGAVVVTKTIVNLFTEHLKSFHYGLTKYQASNKTITQNTGFYNNKAKLWQHIISAINAISFYSDIMGAQDELDAGTAMITNEKSYF